MTVNLTLAKIWHAFCIEWFRNECPVAGFQGFGQLEMGQNCSDGKFFLVQGCKGAHGTEEMGVG
jgi:hypothetical protein